MRCFDRGKCAAGDEWLASQAAAGYVQYHPETGSYAMTTEQAMVLADDTSTAFMAGGFEVLASMFKDEPKISEAFRSGRGTRLGGFTTPPQR
jgi:hypothetical protein